MQGKLWEGEKEEGKATVCQIGEESTFFYKRSEVDRRAAMADGGEVAAGRKRAGRGRHPVSGIVAITRVVVVQSLAVGSGRTVGASAY